ncbi:MAG: type II secretion system F family protein [Clostridiales bacterium]|jgi:type IV pilus assembly protein PilC|nr:type II secretion system F family protein [Clostridiales bacterium]
METNKKGNPRALCAGDVSLFCAQAAMILKSGIPLQDGIGEIGDAMENSAGKEMVRLIQAHMEKNGALAPALRHTGMFPSYMVSMVSIGEKAGRLDNVMEALSLYYEREDRIYRRIRSAVLYPLVLILMMAAVIAVLLIRVLPVFSDVFADLGGNVSDTSGAVLAVGMTIGQVALAVVVLLSLLLAFSLLIAKTRGGSQFLSGLAARFGPTRRLANKISSARFASVMSMMLSSGYDTSDALEMIPDIITSPEVKKKIQLCQNQLREGRPFARAVENAGIFSGIYSGMVSVGAKTGNLDTVMKHLAELYSQDVDETVNRGIAMIEPALAGALSVVIGAILLAVMLPLMGILSSIG